MICHVMHYFIKLMIYRIFNAYYLLLKSFEQNLLHLAENIKAESLLYIADYLYRSRDAVRAIKSRPSRFHENAYSNDF